MEGPWSLALAKCHGCMVSFRARTRRFGRPRRLGGRAGGLVDRWTHGRADRRTGRRVWLWFFAGPPRTFLSGKDPLPPYDGLLVWILLRVFANMVGYKLGHCLACCMLDFRGIVLSAKLCVAKGAPARVSSPNNTLLDSCGSFLLDFVSVHQGCAHSWSRYLHLGLSSYRCESFVLERYTGLHGGVHAPRRMAIRAVSFYSRRICLANAPMISRLP
jgi:hypothetical protein